MRKRHLLPDDQGVRWDAGNGQQALFAYTAFDFPVGAARVWRVQGKTETPVACPDGVLKTEAYAAYRIG